MNNKQHDPALQTSIEGEITLHSDVTTVRLPEGDTLVVESCGAVITIHKGKVTVYVNNEEQPHNPQSEQHARRDLTSPEPSSLSALQYGQFGYQKRSEQAFSQVNEIVERESDSTWGEEDIPSS